MRRARGSERDQVLDLLALWYGDRGFFARYNITTRFATNYAWSHPRAAVSSRPRNLRAHREPARRSRPARRHRLGPHDGALLQPWPWLALMRLTVTTMEREGFEVAMLFAERLDFYTRFGSRPVTRQFSAFADTQTMRAAAGFRLARFDEARDLQEAAALHRDYSGRFNGTVMRDAAGWRGNPQDAGNPGEYSSCAAETRRMGSQRMRARCCSTAFRWSWSTAMRRKRRTRCSRLCGRSGSEGRVHTSAAGVLGPYPDPRRWPGAHR